MDWNEIDIQFGNILKRTRESRGMSQEQFAEMCGISRAYYGRLERGEHSTTLKLCKRISDALGISVSDLLEDII